MQRLYLFVILFLSIHVSAQLPEDALRLSWTVPSGTARQQAIGGAMGSLGGEISAGFVNPAGLGMYKTNEFVMSPGFRFQTTKSDYRGTSTSGSSANNFNLGTSGFVFGFNGYNGNSSALSIAVNRTANFNSNTYYKGQNDYSSFSEQWVEEFSASGYQIGDALASPYLSYGTRMSLYTYLVDTATIGGNSQVISNATKPGLLNQLNNLRTSGGITEIAIALASNSHNKWYFGGTLGIPIMSYKRVLTFTESDATGNTNNDFDSFVYNETYTSKAVGFNFKLGMIFKPVNAVRLGLAVHTPSFFGMTDRIGASLTSSTEGYTSSPAPRSITSSSLDQQAGIDASEVKYNMTTPWKFILSGSYLIGGAQNVRQQKGFITTDIEYITNNTSRFSAPDNNGDASVDDYFNAINRVIKSEYKGSFNFKLGGEMKFNTFMARAGLSYYMSPYADNSLKADRLFASAGIGYRNQGFFVDLTYIEGFTKDVNFPYRLSDKSNTFATTKETSGTLMATFGVKF